MPELETLLSALPAFELIGDGHTPISGIAEDSRHVSPGKLFVAVRGLNTDGHYYIDDAIRRGAAAVVAEHVPANLVVPVVVVPDSRSALPCLAAAYHDFPGRKLKVIGVTGTDGKTTTSNLVRSILEAAGHRTGMVSTVSAQIGGQELDTGFHTTTPEAPDMQRYLAMMVEAGCEYAVLEATSHGLAQGRVDGCEFDVAVVTNITHEHLDYHGSLEAYQQAKASLFKRLTHEYRKPGIDKIAVLNADDSSFAYLSPIPADRQIVYGVAQPAAVSARDIRHSPSGLHFTAVVPGGEFAVTSPLIGRYNVYNILAAIAVGLSQGVEVVAIQAGIAAVRGIVGRMDLVDEGQDFIAIVDFAHTPNALERALETVRELTPGQVIVVFGSAGLRDRAKRSLMGSVAGRLADKVIVTAEDPRTEDLDAIIAESVVAAMAEGKQEGLDLFRVPDRGEAIYLACQMARPGDVVITCGKGHEQSMCFGTVEYPWSDHAALRSALRGQPLRTLPTSQKS